LAKTDLKKLLAADSELEANMNKLLPSDMQNADNLQKSGGEMSTEQLKYFVETVKAKDNVRLLMNNLKSVAPEVYQAMVAERDVFMANGLDTLDQFESIVAVMGIAHVDGVENTLRSRGWIEMKPACPAL
jgi:pheromone shutdown protein TraB